MGGPSQELRPKQDEQEETASGRFRDAGHAYDQIAPFLDLQFDFRQSGINYVCDELGRTDPATLGETLMREGLKLGIAAAAGAVGAATGGLGWVALGAIGAGFAAGDQLVDGVFSDGGAPAGIAKYKMGRSNTLNEMRAEEVSQLRARLDEATPQQWDRAYDDYREMQQRKELQQVEIAATIDGWMNAIAAAHHGTGGDIGEGSSSSMDATTGRLYISGAAYRDRSCGSLHARLGSATLDGLDNAELRNSYLERSIGDIGMFVDFRLFTNGEFGALNFNAGGTGIGIEGGDGFKQGIAHLAASHDGKGSNPVEPEHDHASDWEEGAKRIFDLLSTGTLRDFGLRTILADGMFN